MNDTIKEAYSNKLKSKLYGLLCEREKERDWEKFLDSILVELLGYPEEEKPLIIIFCIINYRLCDFYDMTISELLFLMLCHW